MNSKKTDVALLLLRLMLATIMVAHGSQKLFGWFEGPGLQKWVEGMTSKGQPSAVPYLVAIGEFFGGLGVGVGLLTRLAALGPLLIMLGAVFIVHWKDGFFAQKGGFEYPLALAVVALAILIAGAGAFSLDAALRKKGRRR